MSLTIPYFKSIFVPSFANDYILNKINQHAHIHSFKPSLDLDHANLASLFKVEE